MCCLMSETLNIVTGSEVLLSIAVLSLLLCGINLSTLKMSTGVNFYGGDIFKKIGISNISAPLRPNGVDSL